MQRTVSVIKRTRNAVRDTCGARASGLVRHVRKFHLTDESKLLEAVDLTQLHQDPAAKRILFVGCERWTKPYEPWFRYKEYWSARIGSGQASLRERRHVIDALKNLARFSCSP